jgi:hypothetical protein
VPRFQLVFRRPGQGEQTETRDSNQYAEPRLDNTPIVDGETYTIRGVEWVLRRDELDGMQRFDCTLVAEPGGDK